MSKSRNPKSSLDGLTAQKALSSAKAYEKSGKIEEALQLYENILRVYPANKSAIRAIQILKQSKIHRPNIIDEAPDGNIQSLFELYEGGDLQTALKDSLKLEKQFPNSINLKSLMGAVYFALNEYVAAIKNFQFVLEKNPNSIETYNNLATAYLKLNEPLKALDILKSAIALSPDNPKVHFRIGNIYRTNKKFEKAINHYNIAIKYQPDFINAINNLGLSYADLGNFNQACDCFDSIISLEPENALAFNNMGLIKEKQKSFKEAKNYFLSATKLNSNYASAFYNLGRMLMLENKVPIALTCFHTAVKNNPKIADFYNEYGNAFRELKDPENALLQFHNATKVNPSYANAYANIGLMYQELGDLQKAKQAYETAIELDSHLYQAHYHLSALYLYSSEHPHFKKLVALLEDPELPTEGLIYLNFCLAKAYEDIGAINEAFFAYRKANRLKHNQLGYSINQDEELFDDLVKTQLVISNVRKLDDVELQQSKPIFIVGMPRSGTTLIEQIISAHPDVTGLGELPHIARLSANMVRGNLEMSTENLTKLRTTYFQLIRETTNGAAYFTDKMPHNFRFIPILSCAFPEARIVHVYRDAQATCWSNFRQNFATMGLGYCYDLENLVTYYNMYKDLMRKWDEMLPGEVIAVDYDSLTKNKNKNIRTLLSDLRLTWSDKCLSPEENRRDVRTASLQQVRRGIYQGSSKSWIKFEHHLGTYFEKLN